MSAVAVSIIHDSDHPIAVYVGSAAQRLTREQAETLRRQLDVALRQSAIIVPEAAKGAA
jgi:hypothetical protein